jgi:hypothetical protein
MPLMQSRGGCTLSTNFESGQEQDGREGPTGLDPGWFQRDRSHDGFFVTNQGIVLPSVMPRQPLDKAEEEDQEEDDASQPWITARLKLPQLPKNL